METKVEGRKTACDYYKLPTAYHDISIMTPPNICLHFLFYFVCLFVFPFLQLLAHQNAYKCILLHMYSRYAACLKLKKKKKNKASNYDHKLLKFKKSIIYFN